MVSDPGAQLAGASDRLVVARSEDDVVVVSVDGDADFHVAPSLRSTLDALRADGQRKILVDLTRASFADSAALGALLGAARGMRPVGGEIRVAAGNPHVLRIFEITLLDRVFGLHQTVADAMNALTS